jgi:hypothetical protein
MNFTQGSRNDFTILVHGSYFVDHYGIGISEEDKAKSVIKRYLGRENNNMIEARWIINPSDMKSLLEYSCQTGET